MIHEDENHLIIKIYGFGKEDIPCFILALTDAVKYLDHENYDVVKYSNMLYYIGILIEAFTPTIDQFHTIKLSE